MQFFTLKLFHYSGPLNILGAKLALLSETGKTENRKALRNCPEIFKFCKHLTGICLSQANYIPTLFQFTVSVSESQAPKSALRKVNFSDNKNFILCVKLLANEILVVAVRAILPVIILTEYVKTKNLKCNYYQ